MATTPSSLQHQPQAITAMRDKNGDQLLPLSCMDAAMVGFGLTMLYIFPPPKNGPAYELDRVETTFRHLIDEDYRIFIGKLDIDIHTGQVCVRQSELDLQQGAQAIPFEKTLETSALSTEEAVKAPGMAFMAQRDKDHNIFTAKATLLKDGGLAIGMNMDHVLLDGEGVFTFMKVWGQHYRQVPKEERLVVNHDRHLLCGHGKAPKLPHPEFTVLPPPQPADVTSDSDKQSDTEASAPSFPSTSQHAFHVTPAMMKKIKTIASGPMDAPDFTYVSTIDALTALFITLISQARGHGQDVRFTTGVNARRRLNPPLPPNYAGNVIFNAFSAYSAEELGSELTAETLQKFARRVRKSIIRRDDEFLRDAMDFVASQSNWTRVKVGTNFFFGPDLMFTSWANMGMYDADFGAAPWYVGPPLLPVCDGMAVVMEGMQQAGGLDVLVLLENKALAKLKELWTNVPFWNEA